MRKKYASKGKNFSHGGEKLNVVAIMSFDMSAQNLFRELSKPFKFLEFKMSILFQLFRTILYVLNFKGVFL